VCVQMSRWARRSTVLWPCHQAQAQTHLLPTSFRPAGLWLAPQMVGEALKGGRLAAQVLAREGFNVIPAAGPCNPYSFITGERVGGRKGGRVAACCLAPATTMWKPACCACCTAVPQGWGEKGTAQPGNREEDGAALQLMPSRQATTCFRLRFLGPYLPPAYPTAPYPCSRGAGQQGADGGVLPRGAAVLPHRLLHPASARSAPHAALRCGVLCHAAPPECCDSMLCYMFRAVPCCPLGCGS